MDMHCLTFPIKAYTARQRHPLLSSADHQHGNEQSDIEATLTVSKGESGSGVLRNWLSRPISTQSLFSEILPFDVEKILSDASNNFANRPPPEPILRFQKASDSPLVSQVHSDLIETSLPSSRTSARLLAISTKESGVWLNALPAPSLEILLDDESLGISCAIRQKY